MTRYSEAEYEMLLQRSKANRTAPPVRRKYRNQPTEVDGIRFDSKREAQRWRELCLEQKAGHITNLRRQVPFSLCVNGEHIAVYRCDFQYERDGRRVVEDVKGMATDVYRMKKALMRACHNIEITEVR